MRHVVRVVMFFGGHVVSVVLGHGDTLSRTTEIKLNQNKFVRPLKILCVALDKSRETISLKYCIWGNPCGKFFILAIIYMTAIRVQTESKMIRVTIGGFFKNPPLVALYYILQH